MNAVKPPLPVLLPANALQMFDAILNRLHVTEHHGRARVQSQLVRHLHYFQPLIGVNFQRRNFLAHPIDQNFPAPAGNRSEPSVLKF